MIYKIIVDKQPRTNPSSEKREYTIDIEELRVKGDIYDSLVITKDEDYVMRRLSLNELQVLSVLDEPIKETIPNLNIELFEGDNYIYLLDMTGNKFYAEYIVKNDFTDTYVTTNMMTSAVNQSAKEIELSVNQKLAGYSTTEEMNASINMKANEITSTVSKTYATQEELTTTKSEIKQTTDSIESTVSKKVGNDEIISKINQSAEAVSINASKVNLSGYVTVSNLQTAGKTTINGSNITTGTIDASKVTVKNLNADNITSGTIKGRAISGGTITGTEITNGNNFNVDASGNMTCSDAILNNAKIIGNLIELKPTNSKYAVFKIYEPGEDNKYAELSWYDLNFTYNNNELILCNDGENCFIRIDNSNTQTDIDAEGIITPILTQTSKKSSKKNFEKLDNGLNILRDIDIYKYNLKSEDDTTKKHIGFVIGDNYNYSEEVTSNNNDGVDIYSFVAVCCKAIQEQQVQIENQNNLIQSLIERIEKLEAK